MHSRLSSPVDLDRAPVTGSVAAGHRRLPGELGVGSERPNRLEHRLGPAREHVHSRGDQLGDERGLDADLGIGHELCRLARASRSGSRARPAGGPGLREERQRRDPDPAADEQRPLHVELGSRSRAARTRGPASPGSARAERVGAGADASIRNASSPRGRETQAHRARQQPAGGLDHEELSRHAGVEPAALAPAATCTARRPRSRRR